MTPFSSLLSFYIKSKNIRTNLLAQYCGVDRSNMYKMINGKRNPSSEQIVHKIADYIKLTPPEHTEFLEAYKITLIGYDTYYRRKHTQQFITDFSRLPSSIPVCHTKTTGQMSDYDNREYISLENKHDLQQVIYQILASEAELEHGSISLVIQPSSDFFMKMLSAVCQNRKELCIDHIICLNNASDITTEKLHYNLKCLQEILPLYCSCKCDYNPRYYYDSILSHDSIFSLFSSMIITSRHVLVFSPSLEYGSLFLKEQTIHAFQDIFAQLKVQTTPMIRQTDSAFNESVILSDSGLSASCIFSFQQQPYMIPLLPSLAQSAPYRKQDFLQAAPGSRWIFTESGLADFMQSGQVYEIPETKHHPISPKDRTVILHNLTIFCKSGNYQMLRPDAPIAKSRLNICVSSQNGYLLFYNANKKLVYLNLNEASLLYSFYDYLENLNPDWFYSCDEAIEKIKSLSESRDICAPSDKS